MSMSFDDIQAFLRERDEALLSLDRPRIEAYMAKYGEASSLPKDDRTFWAAIHKARTGARTLPMEARSLSKQWLTERGLSSFDDGDVPLPPPTTGATGEDDR